MLTALDLDPIIDDSVLVEELSDTIRASKQTLDVAESFIPAHLADNPFFASVSLEPIDHSDLPLISFESEESETHRETVVSKQTLISFDCDHPKQRRASLNMLVRYILPPSIQISHYMIHSAEY